MTQQIQKYFGIQLDIKLVTWKEEYSKFRNELVESIKQNIDTDSNNVEVFLYCLLFDIKKLHFGVSPINERLAKLGISIQTSKTVSRKRLIRFINSDISFSYNSEIDFRTGIDKIAFSLSGDYLNQNNSFTDYIAVVVSENCPIKYKVLYATVTAYATERYRRKLINNPIGTTSTKISIPLQKEWKLLVT
jgi:hypothetical protein